MNKEIVRTAAVRLQALLLQYAAIDSEASKLQMALESLVQRACEGSFTQPLEWRQIPGDRLFDEGGLSRYKDLESAYSCFKIEATGGETDGLRAVRNRM